LNQIHNVLTVVVNTPLYRIDLLHLLYQLHPARIQTMSQPLDPDTIFTMFSNQFQFYRFITYFADHTFHIAIVYFLVLLFIQ